jgi:hypothetical protein
VATPIPDDCDKSATVILNIALAARICSLVITSIKPYNWLFGIVCGTEHMNITATERLRDLLAYLDGAYAPNKLIAYRTVMREFITYCECCRTNALPASPTTVADFLMSTLSKDIKTSTIKRKVSSFSAIHRLCGLEDPTKHPMVKIAQRKIY